MPATLDVERARVLAYRVAAQQLDRVPDRPSRLAVAGLGVQDTPYGSARLALAARTSAALDDDALTLVWSTRGAPHLHRRAELARVAAALWPMSDADAAKRIASNLVKAAATLGLAAFTATAEAFRAVVTRPMPKGEVSTAVSSRVPTEVTFACRTCRATHISGALFQQAGLAGGVRLEVVGGKTVLAPIDGWSDPPPVAVAGGNDGRRAHADTAALIGTYLALLGPATPADVAAFVGTTEAELRRAWPPGLAEVRVDGRAAWLPEDRVARLRDADRPRLVRLLPPNDPYLQARDRALLAPDRTRRSELWRPLGNPGALLVDEEIAGVWRARLARSALDVTVTPFAPLRRHVRPALRDEADRMAAARGATEARVRVVE